MTTPLACPDCDRTDSAPPRVVVIDLDGTALRPDDTIDPETESLLSDLAPRGLILVVATARPAPDACTWARMVNAQYVIALNGSILLRPDGDPLWSSVGIPADALALVTDLSRRHRVSMHFHTIDKWHPQANEVAIRAYAKRHGLTPSPIPVEPGTPILQVELVATVATIKQIAAEIAALPGVLATTASDALGSYLDVAPAKVTKANALARVLHRESVTWADVLTLGDGTNDYELFRHARTAVAVPGADSALDPVATHRVSGDSSSAAVRTALLALLDGDATAARSLACTHRG